MTAKPEAPPGHCRVCWRKDVELNERGYCVDEHACFQAWRELLKR